MHILQVVHKIIPFMYLFLLNLNGRRYFKKFNNNRTSNNENINKVHDLPGHASYVLLVQQMQINLCPNMYFGGLTKLLISHLQVAPLFDSVHICVECRINFRQNCYHNQDLQSSNYNV